MASFSGTRSTLSGLYLYGTGYKYGPINIPDSSWALVQAVYHRSAASHSSTRLQSCSHAGTFEIFSGLDYSSDFIRVDQNITAQSLIIPPLQGRGCCRPLLNNDSTSNCGENDPYLCKGPGSALSGYFPFLFSFFCHRQPRCHGCHVHFCHKSLYVALLVAVTQMTAATHSWRCVTGRCNPLCKTGMVSHCDTTDDCIINVCVMTDSVLFSIFILIFFFFF